MRIEDVDQGVETPNFRFEAGISSPAIPVYAEVGNLTKVLHDELSNAIEVETDLPETLRRDAPTIEVQEFWRAMKEAHKKGKLYVVLNGWWDGATPLSDKVFQFVGIHQNHRTMIEVAGANDKVENLPIIYYQITPQRNLRDGQKLA